MTLLQQDAAASAPAAPTLFEIDDLLERIAAGDREALKALYAIVSAKLFAAALTLTPRRDLAEDIVIDTFVAIWRTAARVDWRAADTEPYAWLCATLHRVARTRITAH